MRPTSRFPRVPALLGATALLTASLAGCSAIPGFGGCDPVYPSGDSSSIVTATGPLGSSPEVDFPTPLVAPTPQVSVIEAGDGPLIREGQQVDFTIAIYYGPDGQRLSGDGVNADRAGAGQPPEGLDESALYDSFVCAHVGDRLALTTKWKDAFGEGSGAQQGIADDDTLVFVVDLNAAYLGKADGLNQLPQDGMPVVVTAVDGTPSIAVDFVSKPSATRIETVKGGDGATVRDGDSVVVGLRAWTWPDEGDAPSEISEVDASSGAPKPLSTWADHKAYTVVLGTDTATPPGVQRAITGAKVGSQLLVVIPPGSDHYSTVPPTLAGLTADQTMIWIVDILGIQK